MTTDQQRQRFLDRRGWLRNRRAVVLDDKGITVERWIGRPRLTPWSDLVAARWASAGVLNLQCIGPDVVIDGGVAGLGALADAVTAAMRRRCDGRGTNTVLRGDLQRWLGGTLRVSVRRFELRWMPWAARAPLVLLAAAAAAGCAHYAIWVQHPYSFAWPDSLWRVLIVLASAASVAMLTLLLTSAPLPPRGTWRARADSDHIIIREGGEQHQFGWDTLQAVLATAPAWIVRLQDGQRVPIPRCAQCVRLVETMRHVLRQREPWTPEARPAPDTALSPVEGPSGAACDRGLSRAAGDAVQEALDA